MSSKKRIELSEEHRATLSAALRRAFEIVGRFDALTIAEVIELEADASKGAAARRGSQRGKDRLADRSAHRAAAAIEAVKALVRRYPRPHDFFRSQAFRRRAACKCLLEELREASATGGSAPVRSLVSLLVDPGHAAGRRPQAEAGAVPKVPSLSSLLRYTKPLKTWARDDCDRERADDDSLDPDVRRCRTERWGRTHKVSQCPGLPHERG